MPGCGVYWVGLCGRMAGAAKGTRSAVYCYTHFAACFFSILYSQCAIVIALRYKWHAISFDLVPHFQLWVWPSCSAASAANACQSKTHKCCELCRERNAALSPSSSHILPTHSHSCGGARAQSKYVVTLFLVWVPCAIKGMPEMSTTLVLIAFSICPSCIASFSSRSVIVCVCTSVLNVTPDHTRQKCRLD